MYLLNDFHKIHLSNALETKVKSDAHQKTQVSRNSVIMIIRLDLKETFPTLRVMYAADSTENKNIVGNVKNNVFKKKATEENISMTQFAPLPIFLLFSSTSRILLLLLYCYNILLRRAGYSVINSKSKGPKVQYGNLFYKNCIQQLQFK